MESPRQGGWEADSGTLRNTSGPYPTLPVGSPHRRPVQESMLIPILQIRRLRLRVFKGLSQRESGLGAQLELNLVIPLSKLEHSLLCTTASLNTTKPCFMTSFFSDFRNTYT